MKCYEALIKQSPQTVKRFAHVQYNVFQIKIKLFCIAFSVAMVLAGGFAAKNEVVSLVLIFLGCVLFTNLDVPANYTANKVIAAFNGRFATIRYCLTEDGLENSDGVMLVRYPEMLRLVEDEDYLFIFQSYQYGAMLEKSSISGDGDFQGLKTFVSENAGIEWKRQPTFFNFGLSNIKELFTDTKKHSDFHL